MRASIERAIKVGGNRWDVYVRLETPGKIYRIYIPLVPKQPSEVSVESIDNGRRAVLRLFSGDGGVCSCELDLGRLKTIKCQNISCAPGSTWVADEDLIRSHARYVEEQA